MSKMSEEDLLKIIDRLQRVIFKMGCWSDVREDLLEVIDRLQSAVSKIGGWTDVSVRELMDEGHLEEGDMDDIE